MKTQYKRITRTLKIPCPACWGTLHTHPRCSVCDGTGEVSRTINELVPVTDEEDNEVLLGWAGSLA